jgi:MFS superfamily sulfate permease-like transporter
VLLLVLVLLMPYAALIPMPVIAAILFIVAYNMSEWREFLHVIKEKHWADTLVLVLTFALTVIFDLVVAIVTGLILHYVILLAKNIIANYKKKKSPALTEEIEPLNELVDTEDADVAFGSVEGLPLNQDDNSEL